MSAKMRKSSLRLNEGRLEPIISLEKCDSKLTPEQKCILEYEKGKRSSESGESDFSSNSVDRYLRKILPSSIIQKSSSWSSSSSCSLIFPSSPRREIQNSKVGRSTSTLEKKITLTENKKIKKKWKYTIENFVDKKNKKVGQLSDDIDNKLQNNNTPRESRFEQKFHKFHSKRKNNNNNNNSNSNEAECSTSKVDDGELRVTTSTKKKIEKNQTTKNQEEKETISKRLRVSTQLSTRCSKTSIPIGEWLLDSSDSRSNSSSGLAPPPPPPPPPVIKSAPLKVFGVPINGNTHRFNILSKKQAHERGIELDKKAPPKEKKVKKKETRKYTKKTKNSEPKKKLPNEQKGKKRGRPKKGPDEPPKKPLKKLCSCTDTGCTENVCLNQNVWGVHRSLPKIAELTETTNDIPLFEVPIGGPDLNYAQISVRTNLIPQVEGPIEISPKQTMPSDLYIKPKPKAEQSTSKFSNSKDLRNSGPQVKKIENLSRHVIHLRRNRIRKISNDEKQEPDSTSFGIRTTHPSRSSLDPPKKNNHKDQTLTQLITPSNNEANQSLYENINGYSPRNHVDYEKPNESSETFLPNKLEPSKRNGYRENNGEEISTSSSTRKSKSSRFSPIIFNEDTTVEKKVVLVGKKVEKNTIKSPDQMDKENCQGKKIENGKKSPIRIEVQDARTRITRKTSEFSEEMDVAGSRKRPYEYEETTLESKKTKFDRRKSRSNGDSSSSDDSRYKYSYEALSKDDSKQNQDIDSVLARWMGKNETIPTLQVNVENLQISKESIPVESAIIDDNTIKNLPGFGKIDPPHLDDDELSNDSIRSSNSSSQSTVSESSSSSSSLSCTSTESENKCASECGDFVDLRDNNLIENNDSKISTEPQKETNKMDNIIMTEKGDQDSVDSRIEDDVISINADPIYDDIEEPEIEHCFTKPLENRAVQKNSKSRPILLNNLTEKKIRNAPSMSSLNGYDIMNSQNIDHFTAQNNSEFLADYEKYNDTTNEFSSNQRNLFPSSRKILINDPGQNNFDNNFEAPMRGSIQENVKYRFNGYCFEMLRSIHCKNINKCRFEHRLRARDQQLHEEQPHIIKSILQYTISRNWYYYLSVVYAKSIREVDPPFIISIFNKLGEKFRPKSKNYMLHDYLQPTLESLVEKKMLPMEIIMSLKSTLNNDLSLMRNMTNYFLELIDKGVIQNGTIWNILRDLLISMPKVPPKVVPPILQECVDFKVSTDHIIEVQENIICKMPQSELKGLNQNLLRKFSELLPHNDDSEHNSQASSVFQGHGDGLDAIETSQEVSSYASPDSSSLATVLNHQESVKSFKTNEKSNPKVTPNIVVDDSTRPPWILKPLDNISKPSCSFSAVLWKFHLDLQGIREGLRHDDYSYIIRVLSTLKKDLTADFAIGFYKILCKEIISAPHHLAEIIHRTVYTRMAMQILEILFQVGNFVLITLADIGANELACQLLKTLQPLTFGIKTSHILLAAEIHIATDRPLKALDLIKKYRLMYINRNKWAAKSDSQDEDLRRSVLKMLLKCLCLSHPDDAFNLFKIILEDQNCCYNPIDLTNHADNLVLSLLEHKRDSLLTTMATIIRKHNFALNFLAMRSFISRLLHENEVVAKQLHQYATRLGIYPVIEINTLTRITVNNYWTEEEMYLMMSELLDKLSNEFEFIRGKRFNVYLRFEIMPTAKTLYCLKETDECSKIEMINEAKKKMEDVLDRFDPVIKMIQLDDYYLCKLVKSTIIDYLTSQNVN